MMESPKMLKTLIGKNPDGDALAQASHVYVGGKAESLNSGRGGVELSNAGCDVNSDGASVEGEVGCVNLEGNPARPVEFGNKSIGKGLTKCSEFGGSGAGSENAGGEVKEAGVLEELKDVLVQESDWGKNVAKSGDAMEITVGKLVNGLEGEADQSGDSVEKQDVVCGEGSFSVGDLVWSMAKNNIWWPGVICDPLDAPKQAMKSRVSDKLLVRHFGSKTLVWSPPSHLKHFLESFKEMSGQGKSKSFLGAIRKAAEEVGRRVKLEMSCSCISKEIRARLIGRNKEDFKPWYVSNETAVVHFDPTSFIKRVKNLARMSYVPGVVETAAAQSNLAAFNSYFGHSQMYLRHLREADVTGEEGSEEGSDQSPDTSMVEESPKLRAEDTAGKGSESRERKKSKYLSFPFVDPSSTKALRDPTDTSEASGKRSSSGSKRLLGKSVRKFAPAASSDDLKDLKVSIAQLLTELRDTSRGCFYLNGNTILNSTFDFFCQFRRFAYRDGDSASNWYNDDGVFEKDGLEVQVASPLSEVKPTKKQRKSATSKSEALNNEPMMDQANNGSLKGSSVTPKAQTKNRKRKESAAADHQTDKMDGVPDLNVNGNAPKNHIGKPSNKGKAPDPKRRRNQQGCTAASERVPENGIINAQPISLVVDLLIDSRSLAGLMEANVERHFGEIPASPNAKTVLPGSAPTISPANSGSQNDSEQKGPLHTGIKSETKAENPAPEPEILPPAETTSGLPDLNGNCLEPNPSSVKDLKSSYQAGMIAPASQPDAGGQELPLSVIRNNLEIMTRMMDQSCSNLSPEMRVKLETDVQNLLKKIKDMTGSSGPSS